MPGERPVAVNSFPRLHGIFDSINATFAAADPRLRLPEEFYHPQVSSIMNRVLMEEEYAGYYENAEYRRLGIGPILDQVVQGMVKRAEQIKNEGGDGRQDSSADGRLCVPRLSLYGCHDSTLAATMASLGVGQDDGWNTDWPDYTSNLALEMFNSLTYQRQGGSRIEHADHSLSPQRFYVRLRYNDVPIRIPGCQADRHHLEGDETFCTLVSRKP